MDFKLFKNSNLKFISNFVKLDKSEIEFLYNECPNTKHKIKIFDKMVDIPRYQQAYGRDYPYSGTVSKSKPMPTVIKKLVKEINKIYPKVNFNMCLVNWYLTGNDYIDFHADDENLFEENVPIVGITFCEGLPRKLRFKEKKTKKTVKDVPLYNGSLYSMEGKFQKEFLHGIPKQKKIGEKN